MLYKTTKALLFIIFIGKSSSGDSSPCGDWVAFKDEKCFKVFDTVAPEYEAETVCKGNKNGSILAIIKTIEEQEFINNYLKTTKIADNVWIGIKKTNNSFKWLDGTDVKYTNWAKDRPLKDSTDQNCVAISVDKEYYGKWMDEKCQRKSSILCEKVQPWSVERLQNILLETRKKLTEELNSQKEENKHLKEAVNNLKSNPVPIGFIYVQLSGQSEPKTLWPNTEWKNISAKYSGLFFRAEGGKSSSFGQIQEQQTQSLNLLAAAWCDNVCPNADHGWQRIQEKDNTKPIFTGGYDGRRVGVQMKYSSEEIRPRNQAIRIWQRTK